jgi:hypothetical protein
VELYHGYAGQRITDAGVIRTRSRVKGLRIRDRTCLVNIITVRYTYIVNIITVRVVGHGYASFEITGVGVIFAKLHCRNSVTGNRYCK